jgi:hypothetical protein
MTGSATDYCVDLPGLRDQDPGRSAGDDPDRCRAERWLRGWSRPVRHEARLISPLRETIDLRTKPVRETELPMI